MKFRKKPVVIEAVQFTGNYPEIFRFLTGVHGKHIDFNYRDGELVIHTLEGNMRISLNDWIIKGVKDEFYPCKPDIFETTYEAVEDGA